MKKFRTLTAGLLASAMAMSMTTGFAAFAAEGDSGNAPQDTDYIISVENKSTDNAKHTYEAYQIFTGTMENIAAEGEDEKMQLEVTGWGSGIDSGKLLKALVAESFAYKADFAKAVDKYNAAIAKIDADTETEEADKEAAKADALVQAAKDVADVLTGYTEDKAQIQAFAKVAADNISATKKDSAEAAKVEGKGYVTDIDVEDAGYYLIKDTKNSPTGTMEVNGDNEEFITAGQTRYILTPTTALTPKSKADYPTIDKNIRVEKGNSTELVDFNTAAIRDTIVYQLDSMVPDMDGYNKYYYIVKDSMFNGLTLDPKSFEIKIGETPLKQVEEEDAATATGASFYFKDVEDTKPGYDDFELVFVNFIQYQENKGDDIVITYKATLNTNANVGSMGNDNYVKLEFSNNPNFDYKGTPEKPDEPNPGTPPDEENPDGTPGEPTGETPKVKVITYTTSIKLIKVDAADWEQTLKGAEFTIEGEGVKSVLKAATEYVEDNENGIYYKLAKGTYTKTAPAEDGSTDELYASTTQKYTKTVTATNSVDSTFTKVDMKIDDDGVLELKGLNPGTYTITETKAAEGGYLISKTPAVITITADPSLETCDWTYGCSGVVDATDESDGTLSFKFTNVKGIVLPGTGAFGSKLMYALGSIFTATGAAYMISKKKSKKEEE